MDGAEEKHYRLTLNNDGKTLTLTNIPSKTKEYNTVPLWLTIITLGAGHRKNKIQPRAVITWGTDTYKIRFAGSPSNLYGMAAFNQMLKTPTQVSPAAFFLTFLMKMKIEISSGPPGLSMYKLILRCMETFLQDRGTSLIKEPIILNLQTADI